MHAASAFVCMQNQEKEWNAYSFGLCVTEGGREDTMNTCSFGVFVHAGGTDCALEREAQTSEKDTFESLKEEIAIERKAQKSEKGTFKV